MQKIDYRMKSHFRKAAVMCALALIGFPVAAQESQPPVPSPNASRSAAPARTITIHAKKFEFDPAEITLTKGQTVKLELTSDDVKHSLVIRELGINGMMKKGEDTEVVVTPEQTGDFQGRCGVYCGLGHKDMQFLVHVIN